MGEVEESTGGDGEKKKGGGKESMNSNTMK